MGRENSSEINSFKNVKQDLFSKIFKYLRKKLLQKYSVSYGIFP